MVTEEDKIEFPVWLIGVVTFWSIFLIWYYTYQILHSSQLTDTALLGDSFGALNALFSGLAFAGVIIAIFLQQKELSLQRTELENQRQEFSTARITNIIYKELQTLSDKEEGLVFNYHDVEFKRIDAIDRFIEKYTLVFEENPPVKYNDRSFEKLDEFVSSAAVVEHVSSLDRTLQICNTLIEETKKTTSNKEPELLSQHQRIYLHNFLKLKFSYLNHSAYLKTITQVYKHMENMTSELSGYSEDNIQNVESHRRGFLNSVQALQIRFRDLDG